MSDFMEHLEPMSDVRGFTIVRRKGRSPRIHLFIPWPECNATGAKSGTDTKRFKGSRERLLTEIGKLGYRRGIPCRRCFRRDPEKDIEQPVLEMGETIVVETLDKYDGVTTYLDDSIETPVE